jgi:hypothetical protein
MKVKLLKRLRKDFKWKYKNGYWHTLIEGKYEKHSIASSASILSNMLSINIWKYEGMFDWNWRFLHQEHTFKLHLRNFRNNTK